MNFFYLINLASATKCECRSGNFSFFQDVRPCPTCTVRPSVRPNRTSHIFSFLPLPRSKVRGGVHHCKHQHRTWSFERLRRVVAVTVKPGGPSIATCPDDAARLAGYSVWEVEINQPLSINVVPLVSEDKNKLPLQRHVGDPTRNPGALVSSMQLLRYRSKRPARLSRLQG